MQGEGYASARPYTQAERDRDIDERKRVDQQSSNRRKAMRSGQRYNKTGTPALRRNTMQMLGEKDD